MKMDDTFLEILLELDIKNIQSDMSVVFIYHKNQPNCREIYQSHGSYWSKYIYI